MSSFKMRKGNLPSRCWDGFNILIFFEMNINYFVIFLYACFICLLKSPMFNYFLFFSINTFKAIFALFLVTVAYVVCENIFYFIDTT